MGKSSEKVAARLQSAEHVYMRVDEVICQECQGKCWSTSVHAQGVAAGQQYTTWLFTREHQEQGRALEALGRWLLGHGAIIRRWDDHAYLLERQTTLW